MLTPSYLESSDVSWFTVGVVTSVHNLILAFSMQMGQVL